MGEDEIAALRRKVALYRAFLAKGLDSAIGTMYLFEIARLERILDQAQANQGRNDARSPQPVPT